MENFIEILDVDPEAKVKAFKKGDIIQFVGDFKASTFYVQKGLLRSYIIDSKFEPGNHHQVATKILPTRCGMC